MHHATGLEHKRRPSGEDLGVRLFERDSKGVRVTHAGEQLVMANREEANFIISEVRRLSTKFGTEVVSKDGVGVIRL